MDGWYPVLVFDSVTNTIKAFQIYMNAKGTDAFSDLETAWFSSEFYERAIFFPTTFAYRQSKRNR